jgi:D-2-hydroxyglutarate dehydrogenase
LKSLEKGLVSDGVIAQDINQASSFWRIREGITEALQKAGAVYKYDLSLPVEEIYNIVNDLRGRLGKIYINTLSPNYLKPKDSMKTATKYAMLQVT